MVEEGRTGLLAPRGNVRELARAIEFLLDHDQERAAMAVHARRRVEEVFPRDGQVQNTLTSIPDWEREMAAAPSRSLPPSKCASPKHMVARKSTAETVTTH